MFKILENYKEKGQFRFLATDILSQVCTAPKENSGIYLIYADEIISKNLIYIGISGRKGSNGEIIHRKDGLGGRIVKGKQFGESRRKSWPKKMYEDNINVLLIKWYITYGKYDQQFPRPLENKFLSILVYQNGYLPLWNKET